MTTPLSNHRPEGAEVEPDGGNGLQGEGGTDESGEKQKLVWGTEIRMPSAH